MSSAAHPGSAHAAAALAAARAYLEETLRRTLAAVSRGGKIDAALVEQQQRRMHGLAWIATAVEALTQLLAWGRRLEQAGRSGPGESLVLAIGFGEYLAQIMGGLPMSQCEMVRPRIWMLPRLPRDLANTRRCGIFSRAATPRKRGPRWPSCCRAAGARPRRWARRRSI